MPLLFLHNVIPFNSSSTYMGAFSFVIEATWGCYQNIFLRGRSHISAVMCRTKVNVAPKNTKSNPEEDMYFENIFLFGVSRGNRKGVQPSLLNGDINLFDIMHNGNNFCKHTPKFCIEVTNKIF